MQPIVPTISRTGDPVHDRNLDAIATAFRRLGQLIAKTIAQVVDAIPAPDDHKVSTDTTDEAADGAGYLLAKLSSNGNVKPTLDTTSGQRRVRHDVTLPAAFPGYFEGTPSPNGTGWSGDDPLVSHGNHVHSSAVHASVKAFCTLSEGLALDFWTEGPTGTWTKDAVGSVSATSWCDDVVLVNSDRIFVGDTIGMVTGHATGIPSGLYDITNIGGPAAHAVIVRSSDANTSAKMVPGLQFLVSEGTYYGGQTWYLATPPPIVLDSTNLDWALGGSTGTTVHNSLSGRDVNFSSGGCHPADALGPGRLHRNMGTASDVDGMVTMPSDASQAELGLSIPYLAGIDPTGFSHGDPIAIFIGNATPTNPKTLQDGVSSLTPPFLPLSLPTKAGVPQHITCKGPTLATFWYDSNGYWRLSAPVVTYVVLPS